MSNTIRVNIFLTPEDVAMLDKFADSIVADYGIRPRYSDMIRSAVEEKYGGGDNGN